MTALLASSQGLDQVPMFAVATLLMVVAGLSKHRFELRPRHDLRRWLLFLRRPHHSGRP